MGRASRLEAEDALRDSAAEAAARRLRRRALKGAGETRRSRRAAGQSRKEVATLLDESLVMPAHQSSDVGEVSLARLTAGLYGTGWGIPRSGLARRSPVDRHASW
jgi:hypothetical protein